MLSSTTRLKLFFKKKEKQNAEEALLQETTMEYIFVVKMWNDTFYSIENIIKKTTTIKNAVPKINLKLVIK